MASQCKRQQCTFDRRGVRQELDSWRHKLIHCVGFESIIEGLLDAELLEDLKLFKDLEPTAVSDWSFDENCVFCCLRRDKVKEHLIGLSDEELEDRPKPVVVKDQTTISRLEEQAEEFLNAILCRKDVPNFSDPHIPVVAREILQRMIRQFAAEYTSKTSSPQDSPSDTQPHSDQSLTSPSLLSGAPPSSSAAASRPAHNQNPVLSKLLMADQDAPLDLTVKKPAAPPCSQDGVLDLSIKKNRHSNSPPTRRSCLSPSTATLKGDPDAGASKIKELQSASTLEQFMAKLCVHHQRQMVDAIGFLQTEVKALASSSGQQDSTSTSGIQGSACSTAKYCADSPEQRIPREALSISDIQRVGHSIPSSFGIKKDGSVALVKTPVTSGPALDLCSPASKLPEADGHPADHAPLKMKIMTSNVADGKKLSCVLTHPETLENREGLSNPSGRAETHGARLSSSVKRHSHHTRHRGTLGHAKNRSTKMSSAHRTAPSDSPRTARKTMRTSDHRIRDSVCRRLTDPDLGHYDIVFIDKPITECFKERRRSMLPRRNARKSTRGHMYSDEIWELKTVRTLAGKGNCPNPMPELITLVTPKQILSKPEGVPPVDRPFAGACRESLKQQMTTEESDESVIPGTGDMVEVADGEVDVIVETSQTELSQSKGCSVPPSPAPSLPVSQDADKQDAATESGIATEKEDDVIQDPLQVENSSEPEEDKCEGSEETVEALEKSATDAIEPRRSEELPDSVQVLEQNSATSPINPVAEVAKESVKTDDRPLERQPDTQMLDSVDGAGETEEMEAKEIKIFDEAGGVVPAVSEDYDDEDYDVSSKTLDALLKELPPWRRKKGTVIALPKRLRQAETVVVGYFNGRPISASDRSLRRRSSHGSTSPHKTPVKSNRKTLTVDSKAEDEVSDKAVPEPPSESFGLAVVQSESPPAASKSPETKCPSKAKQGQKNSKRVQRELNNLADQSEDVPQSTESKRQLRSAGQKPTESPVSPPTPDAVASIPPPAPEVPAQDDHPPVLPSASPLHVSPPVTPCCAANADAHQDAVPVTTAQMDTDHQSPQTTSKEEQEGATELPTEQEEGLVEEASEESRSEKQPLIEDSSPLENLSQPSEEMEAQVTPLRSKRALRKDSETNENALPPKSASLGSVSAADNDTAVSEKPRRMPLRSETSKPETSHQTVAESPVDKKSVLRSQRAAAPSASAAAVAGKKGETASPSRIKPEKTSKAQLKPPVTSEAPQSSGGPVITLRSEPPKQTANKFFELLSGDESQQLITNLNMKYDKMQKGWVQIDKECPPVAKYRNRADRQAAIWKSKRRARKAKGLEHQKYSPVQMLFMKGFNLSSICRWFLESTETKSLVIVKKMNTRLPSEHQLCFHSSSNAAGSSQGVFPSLQAERLKKHLKKFAIASPVKSNPKSRKLIAKALEQDAAALKGGKEKREGQNAPRSLSRSRRSEALMQAGESQKSSGKTKNPASARILRKYSNIREKMQVQQSSGRLKEASKSLRTHGIKRLSATKAAAKSRLKPSLKAQKSHGPDGKRIKASAARLVRAKTLSGKKATKPPAQRKVVKEQSGGRVPREFAKKEPPKRSSQRLGSPKLSEHKLADASKSKQQTEKPDPDKPSVSKGSAAKVQSKESTPDAEVQGAESAGEAPHQTVVKVAQSPDQVLTRSQRKMETALPERTSKATKPPAPSAKSARKADEAALARVKSSAKKGQGVSSLRSATKRSQEPAETPAKRTRTSLK
ncbi:nascent polypeptide-associated complex subunit alpha, muscle-specific form isoform X1 [Takifugu flavidus]|uniref:nascent polypeptide-associated complex subunit alpha, muscle-specific form isoform X1 n=3 Tax=Takifugu flavidus TaxID=433684 RepID=UPI002544350B|nr:nascent polypeptide-associated complex subunit alpha, muscle-specific form isoform X1 [Takifugu flavidus]